MANFWLHYFINNWLTLAILIGLIIVAARHQNMDKNTAKLFILASCCCILCSFFAGLDYYYGRSEFTSFHQIRAVGSLFTYALKPLPSVFVLNFIMEVKTKKQRWIFGAACVPAVVNIIICMLTFIFKDNLVCWFTEFNHFTPGNLRIFPSIVGYLYIAAIAGVCIYRGIRRDFEEVYAILFMVLMVIIATLFEFVIGRENFFAFESSLITASTAIGLMFIYFHLYITRNKIDPLTKLYNRGSFYYDIKKYKKDITGIISIDMNNLKFINDNNGHDAGDKALSTIGDIIGKNVKGNKAYRVGGDEFLIVSFKEKDSKIDDMMENIRKQVTKKNYSVALGYCPVGGKRGPRAIEDALKIADDFMYKDKRTIKRNLAAEKAANEVK